MTSVENRIKDRHVSLLSHPPSRSIDHSVAMLCQINELPSAAPFALHLRLCVRLRSREPLAIRSPALPSAGSRRSTFPCRPFLCHHLPAQNLSAFIPSPRFPFPNSLARTLPPIHPSNRLYWSRHKIPFEPLQESLLSNQDDTNLKMTVSRYPTRASSLSLPATSGRGTIDRENRERDCPVYSGNFCGSRESG